MTICKSCKKEFDGRKTSKYCSRKCASDGRNTKIDIECKYCKTIFKTFKGRINTKFYCSNECKRKASIVIGKKKCLQCNKLFIGYSNRKFCTKRCSEIYNHDCRTNDITRMRDFITRYNFKIIEFNYKHAKSKITLECENGHKFITDWNRFYNKRQYCIKCNSHSSIQENDLYTTLCKLYPEKTILSNYKKIIYPKEVDIFFKDHNLAIEYCGLYWHSEEILRKKYKLTTNIKNYHRKKLDLCNQNGIRLITIFEDEWINKREICLSIINNIINRGTSIYARKCQIREIDSETANTFFNINHLQGKTRAKLYVGLYYNDTLVKCLAFGNPSRNIKNCIELKREATLLGHNVIGGSSKLLKYTYNKLNIPIRSYVDLRYFTGDSYHKIGFKYVGESKYTPHYVKGLNRYRNQGLRKTVEERKTGLTEWELRQAQGYRRIWDCGHQTWEYSYV